MTSQSNETAARFRSAGGSVRMAPMPHTNNTRVQRRRGQNKKKWSMHWLNAGTPELEAKLWSFVDKQAPNGCWLWMGPRNGSSKSPYLRGKNEWGPWSEHSPRRLIYGLMSGQQPKPGQFLVPLCRNSMCVNPEHISPEKRGNVAWQAGLRPAEAPKSTSSPLLVARMAAPSLTAPVTMPKPRTRVVTKKVVNNEVPVHEHLHTHPHRHDLPGYQRWLYAAFSAVNAVALLLLFFGLTLPQYEGLFGTFALFTVTGAAVYYGWERSGGGRGNG